jgi:hypothetical protein
MEVLKSIDVLTEDSGITDDDFLVWFDESLKTHKKIKKSDFGGSKWTDGTFNAGGFGTLNGIIRNSYVTIGQSSLSDLLARSAKLLVKSDYSFNSDSAAPAHFQVLTASNQNVIRAYANNVEILDKYRFTPTGFSALTGGLVFSAASGSDIQFSGRNFGILADSNQVINFSFGNVAKMSMQFVSSTTTLVLSIQDLPTSDPLVSGEVWRSGNDLKISTG